MHRSFPFFLVSVIVLVASCQRAKDTARAIVGQAKGKAGELWGKAVKEAINASVTNEATSFKEQYGKAIADSLKVEELGGQWIDFPMGFHYCFLKYKADKETIITFVNSLPATSDAAGQCEKNDGKRLFGNLRMIEKDHPQLLKDLAFFMEIKQKKNLEYYECIRMPIVHCLAFDPERGIVYHHFENCTD